MPDPMQLPALEVSSNNLLAWNSKTTRNVMKNLAIFVGVLISIVRLGGATPIGGLIANQTLFATNGPYTVVGDVTISNVTVEAGSSFIFQANYQFNLSGL